MVNGRQRQWSIRRLSVELPEEADVEDIMETGSRRKSQADGNLIDELHDAVIAWGSDAAARWRRRSRTQSPT